MIVDIQFIPPTAPWPALRDLAVAAETAGYGAVWVFDHLAGRSVNAPTMLEPFTLLGALATATQRIALGTLVLNVSNRRPAVLAAGVASLGLIARRRLLVGLGAGSAPGSRWAAEMHAVGEPVEAVAAHRAALVERTMAVCRTAWAADRPPALSSMPAPPFVPEIHVGGSSERLATIAGARADGFNIAWNHPRRDELVSLARGARRTDRPLVVSTFTRWDRRLLDPDEPQRRSMARAGVERLVLVARDADPSRLADLPAGPSIPS